MMVGPTFDANLLTTVNVLMAAHESNCDRVVIAGSIEESRDVDPAPPSSPYAASKMAASLYAKLFASLYGSSIITLHIAFVYGPGQLDFQKLVPYVIRSYVEGNAPALTEGSRVVDWIHVSDVVDAAILAGELDDTGSHAFSIGTGTGTSIRELAGTLAELCGALVPPEFGSIPNRPLDRERVADITRATEVLGWKPKMDLNEGLRTTVAWYKELLAHVDG
jgi:nucleoside-diphosphate-sugar epimerase